MSSIPAHLSVLCWAVAVGLFAWYIGDVSRNITYVTLADGRRQERRLPLTFRLVLPLAPNFRRLFDPKGPFPMRDNADAMIVSGGYEGLLSGWEFLALKCLLPLCFGPFWIILLHMLGHAVPMLAQLVPALSVLGLLLLYVYPMSWLRGAVKRRRNAVLRALPFVLDLLTLSVEAGLDFMTALQRCTERRVVDPLTEEIMRVIRQTQVGATRRDALRAMADRVGLPDLRSVVNALVQADDLGVSVGAILRIQSDQVRSRRFERAERLANEAPTKLLGPLMIFIFPSVFLILMGPVVYQMIQQV